VTGDEVLAELVALAQAAGLRVQIVRGAASEGEGSVSSGVCVVAGEPRAILVRSDPVADRIEVLAGALRTHAGAWLDAHYVPPAIREWLEQRETREP
jgi:hypothetical protein